MSPSAETSNGGGYKCVLELSNSFCFVSLLLSSFCLKPFLYIQRSYDPKKQCYDGFTAKFSFGWDSWDVISSTEPAASQVKSCASEIFLIQGFRFAKPHDLFASWPLIMSAELWPPWIATQKADHGRAVISIIWQKEANNSYWHGGHLLHIIQNVRPNTSTHGSDEAKQNPKRRRRSLQCRTLVLLQPTRSSQARAEA